MSLIFTLNNKRKKNDQKITRIKERLEALAGFEFTRTRIGKMNINGAELIFPIIRMMKILRIRRKKSNFSCLPISDSCYWVREGVYAAARVFSVGRGRPN